ncbi:anoctamin-6-like [Tachypleus tridentatus]|uniref:anoctamin-6-like n=1 Tax=Tachypleus tridentatus TaxID=6853 RepID=UPI003FD5D8B6
MVSLTTSVTAALLNLVCIMTFNLIYRRIATFLTELEIHRTQSDYENSLTLKMYMLKFVISFLHFLKEGLLGIQDITIHCLDIDKRNVEQEGVCLNSLCS